MRIWIDVLTPKQANLFSVLARRIREQGHEILITTRRYREVEELLKIRRIRATAIGSHGGGDLFSKLVESSRRTAELATYVREKKPDATISFCSPEAARASFGLGVPHYAICDSPHAEAVCKLSLPLSRKLFSPIMIPRKAWSGYGISSAKIVRYSALDPAVWIRAYAGRPSKIEDLRLSRDKPTVLIRTQEEYASYLLSNSIGDSSLVKTLARSLRALDVQIVVLPRYKDQIEALRKELSGFAVVPANVIDALELMSQTSVFIGAGGTMTAEAALMGIPAISCYPSEPTYVDRYLFRSGLAERILSPAKIVSRVRTYLSDPKLAERQKKARVLLSRMEDPVRVIMTDLGLLRRG